MQVPASESRCWTMLGSCRGRFGRGPGADHPLFPNRAESHPSMAKRSSYQDRIIKNYYQNFDAIMVQRLGEMVTDLYLAEGKARTRLWDRAARR